MSNLQRLIHLQAYFFVRVLHCCKSYTLGSIISFTRTREVVLDAFFTAWVCTKLVGRHNQEALLLLLMLAQGRIIQTQYIC